MTRSELPSITIAGLLGALVGMGGVFVLIATEPVEPHVVTVVETSDDYGVDNQLEV